ncbi:MAG: glycoside hydrolase family 3 N-terminal domain-containing protein [Gemmatimonadaceae bacterium]
MSDVAQLLVPALRWDSARGYEGQRDLIERGLTLGVGGFILFGGEQEAVRALTKELRQRSRVPLLIGADLERGAGQQFAGATGLPPLAAIAWLNDVDAIRKAARLTAREARTLGVNWDYAPVCDLDIVPENPIIGTRSLGSDPQRVAALATEWIAACQAEGVLACAKHFPGHGRTRVDSHAELPTVIASKRELMATDLVPFRAAIAAGVASMMTSHVAYPALDPSGAPATLSRELLHWLLRQQFKFDGLIVTDALIMEGIKVGHTEGEATVRAINAGCDLLLYPTDLEAVAAALERAVTDELLEEERVAQSVRRRLKWAQWASPPNEYRKPSATDVAWGAQLADRVVHLVRGEAPPAVVDADVIVVDDDVGGPYPPPSREPFLAALAAAGVNARRAESADTVDTRDSNGRSVVVALFGDIRSWKGRPGYSADTRAAVERACAAARQAVVVQFSHPRLAAEIAGARTVVSAWGGESAMQQAAARWLARGGRAT